MKAQHTNKGFRHRQHEEEAQPVGSFIEDGAYVDGDGVTRIGTPPWGDYGEGKTYAEESRDSVAALGIGVAASAIVLICIIVALAFWLS